MKIVWRYCAALVIFIMAITGDAYSYKVKYLSGENVYLDTGSNDSLAVGDHLTVIKGEKTIAELEIVFVADHSSSCRIVRQDGPIETGLIVNKMQNVNPVVQAVPSVIAPEVSTKPVEIKPALAAASTAGIPGAKIDGSVSFQFYRWNDTNPSNLDFTQPGSRLNLKASRLWNKDITLNLRMNSLYYMRTRRYNSDVPKTQWRNRVYQASLTYGNDQSPFSFEVGRIISNKLSGIGYVDGLMVQKRVSSVFQIGGFGGTQPQWQYSTFQTSLQKYGAFLSYERGNIQKSRLESVVAASGEYHGRTVSREFLFLRNNVNITSRWNIYQNAEIDINRSWRKEKVGKSLSLSNLYLSARGRFTNWLSAGLSFDDRKNYWTYEIRSLADNLFDNALREGVRADISLRPGKSYFVFSNVGYNKRSTDSRATYSYALGLNRANFISSKQFLNFQAAGFTSPFTNGYNFSAKIGRYIFGNDMISLGYTTYIYSFGPGGISRHNQSVQVSSQLDIVRQVYFSGSYEYDTGDDSRGHRLLGELGYRF
jgi:hypothetical protein